MRLATIILFFVSVADAHDVHVNGYVKQDGTYVAPHERTAPDSTINNNYSTQGNTNPYTGQAGHVKPDSTSGSNTGGTNSNLKNAWGH